MCWRIYHIERQLWRAGAAVGCGLSESLHSQWLLRKVDATHPERDKAETKAEPGVQVVAVHKKHHGRADASNAENA